MIYWGYLVKSSQVLVKKSNKTRYDAGLAQGESIGYFGSFN